MEKVSFARTFEEGVKIAWSRITKGKEDECWEWPKINRVPKDVGYGQIRIGGKIWKAHRLIWTSIYGEIEKGLELCHHCDNPPCCNPSHLFLGTCLDNQRDSAKKGRRNNLTGEKNNNAKMTKEKVIRVHKLIASGNKHKDIAAEMNVTVSCIRQIAHGSRWPHLHPDPVVREKKSRKQHKQFHS